MERLVLTYTTGDGYTFSFDMHVPFEAPSKAEAIAEMETLYLEAAEQSEAPEFHFVGERLRVEPGEVNIPLEDMFTIRTLDEWFAYHKAGTPGRGLGTGA